MSITCVTAFYNIGRMGVDGRSVSDYKAWLYRTLVTVRDPFVVYLDKSLGWKSEILTLRGDLDVVETDLNEIPMWKYRDTIANILVDPTFKATLRHPRDITNLLPEYCTLQYSKFGWLEAAIARNPFGTSHFAWLDAGSSRFYDTRRRYISRPGLADTFYIEVNSSRNRLGTFHPDSYIGTCECVLHGTMWVMTPRAFVVVRDEVMRIFHDEMITKRRIDNEQIALVLSYPIVKDSMTLVDAHGSHGNVFFGYIFM